MSNTIAPRSAPVSVPVSTSTAPTRTSSQSAATGANANMAADEYNALAPQQQADIRKGITLGDRVTTNKSKEEIAGCDVKSISAEEILGMNKQQWAAFTKSTDKGGAGVFEKMDQLSPAQRKAVLRKTIIQSLMADFKKMASKYDK